MSGDNMEVQINGIPYLPAANNLGIGITTKNRPEALTKAIEQHKKHLPPGATIIVVDDGSKTPVELEDVTVIRHNESKGIAASKNRCIAELYDLGCEHFTLWDDDAYPIADNWHKPYVNHPEPHLFAVFTSEESRLERIFETDTTVAYHATRGYMLYAHRSVIDRVGGMDTKFQYGFEHVEWSDRIHNAKLTTFRYQDVPDSDKLIYSMDQHAEVTSSIADDQREQHEAHGRVYYEECRGSDRFVPFRELSDVVATALFTGVTDSQRGTKLPAKADVLQPWLRSIPGRKVVFHNELTVFPQESAEFLQVTCQWPIYFQRWLSYYEWLKQADDVRFVWFTDGTDVEMLREPWEHMQPGKLYVGSEPKVVGIEWMRENHKARFLQRFLDEYSDRQLLNAGLVGGDRETVLDFVHAMVRQYLVHETDRLNGWDPETLGVGDMALFNQVAWTQFADRLVYGSRVNTVFKAEERNDFSFWRHK